MVTVNCPIDAVKTFSVVGKPERKSMGDYIEKIIDRSGKARGLEHFPGVLQTGQEESLKEIR